MTPPWSGAALPQAKVGFVQAPPRLCRRLRNCAETMDGKRGVTARNWRNGRSLGRSGSHGVEGSNPSSSTIGSRGSRRPLVYTNARRVGP